ncbi:hypothetical protein [Nakamurella aerolata]|uniref:Uncharacterized protein n=1 Tax=Nakamurella aerolata TaxID=1656892 RepID=A0A849A9V5_9ACTN|nr:hypothetical protein [Nakamurella aerolata]NNG36383.1 hypothetical protein [Nakamurella aerolata]
MTTAPGTPTDAHDAGADPTTAGPGAAADNTAAAATDSAAARPGDELAGVIRKRAMLDLTGFTRPEELAAITGLERIAVVVVRRSLAAAYTLIPADRIANSVFVPDDAEVRIHTGSLSVSGDALAGDQPVALVVTGMLLITSPVTAPVTGSISVTGTVLVPRGSEGNVGAAMSGTGALVPYAWAEDQQVRLMSGQSSLSGAALTNTAGQPQDILVLAGQTVITGEVGDIGYQQILVAGQSAASVEAQASLEQYLTILGQFGWYRGSQPRTLLNDAELAAGYFELIQPDTSLVVFGNLTLADDVTPELLRQKVTDIVLFGNLTAPAALVPMVQALTIEQYGNITAAGSA